MLRSVVHSVLLRDLGAVRRSVEAYPDDASPWAEREGLPNAGGTLVLHLAGNLRHYVGAVLGGSGYVRDRPAEFARRGVSRAEMVAELDAARDAVERGLAALADDALVAPYPERIAGRTVATGDFLVHLAVHLAYHLGQLDYHRRVVTGDPRSIGAVAAAELPDRGHERAGLASRTES
ncbi:MAG: DinB family protein [Gemmatimonadaceae bacterium]